MAERLSTPDASSTAMVEEHPILSQPASVHQDSVDWSSKKIKRRSKKDKTGRNFICGCGKQYLSYPALYTHIKTKHNGVQPMGTKNHLALHSKRGRPKKIELRNPGDRDSPDEAALALNSSPSLLAQLITDNNLAHKNILEKSDLNCLKVYGFQGKTDASVGFPVIYSCNEEKASFHPFHVIINHFKFSNVLSGYVTKNPSCDTIIALFLYSISRLITDKFYIVIGIFFRNLRECLNTYGYEVISEYFEKNTGQKREDLLQKKREGKVFCEVETCEFLPLIAEKLIMEYLPEKCPNFESELAIDTMYDFCNWLHKKRFAKVKVRFRNDENANLNSNLNVNVMKP